MKSLAQKLWVSLCLFLLVTIIFAYFLSDYLYERLYVNNVEAELITLGEQIRKDYEGGVVPDSFIKNVEWLNSKTPYEVFAVRNPRELSACVPFDIDYEALIGPNERTELLANVTVTKVGFEERFGRTLVSVVVPLLDGDRLQGIIYLYFPLVNITELTSNITWYWLFGSFIFIFFVLFIGMKAVQVISRPIEEMKKAAEKVSEGNLSARVTVSSNDEIGQLAQSFNEMAEALQKEDQRNKNFLATVSHELRTPISYIKGYIEALQLNIISEEKRDDYMMIVQRESQRMEKIVGDLLELMKMETAQFSIEKLPLVLAEIIRQSLDNVKPAAEEKGLFVSVSLDEELIIFGDEGRIEQIFYNVFSNSLRHTVNGGISISLFAEGEFAYLVIEDTGSGIPEQDLPKVTERFFRVNKARSRKDGGSGLGLSIVKNLVMLHEGELKIQSRVGEGTKVTIIFPLFVDKSS
ncbi:HAMP domain-containing sensor histidine kinase [Bacillus spongiae]|uniref:histidine kinase n=1 Tax=Bacillus spongiae TaxID=2683610 RepID=A0ABU8HB32_9BACI